MTTSHQRQMLNLTMKKWVESRKTCGYNVCKACNSLFYTDMAGINEQCHVWKTVFYNVIWKIMVHL